MWAHARKRANQTSQNSSMYGQVIFGGHVWGASEAQVSTPTTPTHGVATKHGTKLVPTRNAKAGMQDFIEK